MIRVAIFVIIAKTIACIDEEVHEKYLTMPREEFIEYFNNQNFSWKIAEYNRTFAFGKHRHIKKGNFQKECNFLKDLPKTFDAREKWPKCETIKEIYDQGDCGSSWAFSVANSMSDRSCVINDIHVHLSEQDLQCAVYIDPCAGCPPWGAFSFWSGEGLVSNKCKPYDVQKFKNEPCTFQCVDKNMSYFHDKHSGPYIYEINEHIDCIKSDIVLYGPVHVSFTAFQDFKDYHGGIYEHKYGLEIGDHSVRVIGYGVEDDKEYWLAANSWGDKWGEKGFFRIKIKHNHVGFERDVLSGIPQT